MANKTPRSGSKRPQGAGGIDQLRSGLWRARVRTPDRERLTRTFATREEAESFLRGAPTVLAEMAEAEPPGTLLSYGPGWLERRDASGQHRAIRTERSLWKCHIASAPIALVPLQEITRKNVRDWLADLQQKRATAPKRGKEEHDETTRRRDPRMGLEGKGGGQVNLPSARTPWSLPHMTQLPQTHRVASFRGNPPSGAVAAGFPSPAPPALAPALGERPRSPSWRCP